MLPELDPDDHKLPRGSVDLGDSYVLLRAKGRSAQDVERAEADAIKSYIQKMGVPEQEYDQGDPRIVRWARLHLPNGQIARSAWKEKLKPLARLRTSRNVKVSRLRLITITLSIALVVSWDQWFAFRQSSVLFQIAYPRRYDTYLGSCGAIRTT
jgi:hypothetical protein